MSRGLEFIWDRGYLATTRCNRAGRSRRALLLIYYESDPSLIHIISWDGRGTRSSQFLYHTSLHLSSWRHQLIYLPAIQIRALFLNVEAIIILTATDGSFSLFLFAIVEAGVELFVVEFVLGGAAASGSEFVIDDFWAVISSRPPLLAHILRLPLCILAIEFEHLPTQRLILLLLQALVL